MDCSWLKQLSLKDTWWETYPGLELPDTAESINIRVLCNHNAYSNLYIAEISTSSNPKTISANVLDIKHCDLVLLRDNAPEGFMEVIRALKKELNDYEDKAKEIRDKFETDEEKLLLEIA